MNRCRFAPLFFLGLVMVAGPAFANDPPAPPMMLSEVLLLPFMMLMTALGGGYAVLYAKGKKKRRFRVVAAVLAVILSGAHEGFGLIVALIFTSIALGRAVRMAGWSLRAAGRADRPEHLVSVRPLQMFAAGAVLACATVFLFGLALASLGAYRLSSTFVETPVRQFVAHQLAYAEEHGAFDRLVPSPKRGLGGTVDVEYGDDGASFTLDAFASRSMPFWPYNYLIRQRAYRADETGQIRLTWITRVDQRCPPDAPVVWKVMEFELNEARARIADARQRLPYMFVRVDPDVVAFVAYQLAYAQDQETTTGERRFDSEKTRSPRVDRDDILNGKVYETIYDDDARGFTLHVHDSQTNTAYRADESGGIQMWVDIEAGRCPESAPTVWQVTDAEIALAREATKARGGRPPFLREDP